MTTVGDETSRSKVSLCDQPILLAGEPPSCRGYVLLENRTTEAVRVRQLVLRTCAGALLDPPNECPEPPIITLSMPAVAVAASEDSRPNEADECQDRARGVFPLRIMEKIPGCECREAQVELRVAPTTMPGVYEATVECVGGPASPAIVHVLEKRETRIHPAFVASSVYPGQELEVGLVAKNLGNVSSLIAQGVVVHLQPIDQGWHQHFHRAAKAKAESGYEPVLNDFVERLGQDELPPSRAKIVEGDGPLGPRQSRWVRLKFAVPKSLAKGRRYQAVMRLADGSFAFVLNVTEKLIQAEGSQ